VHLEDGEPRTHTPLSVPPVDGMIMKPESGESGRKMIFVPSGDQVTLE